MIQKKVLNHTKAVMRNPNSQGRKTNEKRRNNSNSKMYGKRVKRQKIKRFQGS
jgi:hypothetical protein